MTMRRSWQRHGNTSNDSVSLEAQSRSSLLAFCRFTYPTYAFADHLIRLAGALSAVEGGLVKRLLVTTAPRHGKSELCSVRFPAWYLGRNPDKRIIIASYAADLAERFSRQVRAVVAGDRYPAVFPGVTISPDSRSVATWDLAKHRGGLKAVGVGGPLTGFGANVLVVDDPVKNRAEAQSEVYRNSVWDWYTSTAYTRLEDAGAVVVVMTRWHENDLMGRLLAAEADGTGDTWTKLHLPALDEQGRALWPEKYSEADLAQIKLTIGEYDWSALYMGTPTPREGAFFKVSEVRIVDALPAALPTVRAWDVAATPGDGDYTAGALMAGPDADGRFYVADMVRGQWATDERNRTMRQTAELDGPTVRVLVPQDPGSAGVDASRAFVRLLSGYSVEAIRVTGEKALRADPFSSQVNAGNVRMLRGAWNRATLEEMRSFPLGRNDDQVDALADAFNALTRRRIVRAY